MKDFNRAMLEYFGHPGHSRGTTAQFAHRALDCMLSCQVRLLIVDDLHFLRWRAGRRTTALDMRSFTVDTDSGRREWRQMLLAIEQRLALAGKYPGMLADELSDYLFARSTGHIGSLMTLINRGCQRAVRTGTERLDRNLLDSVKNDAAAETAHRELDAAIQARRLTTRLTQTGRRAG